MRRVKRYGAAERDKLLAAVVTVAESAGEPDYSDAASRNVIAALSAARLGDFALDAKIQDQLARASSTATEVRVRRMRDLLRMFVGYRDKLPAGVLPVLALPGIVVRGVPFRSEYVIEVGLTRPNRLDDPLWLQLIALVRQVGARRLERCDCKRVFVAVGKRKFCSERCQKRVYMRKYRAVDVKEE